MPKILKTITKTLDFDMSVKKRWFVNSVEAEYWGEKKSAPNVHTDMKEHTSLESARNDIRSRIGNITTNLKNKIECISWLTNCVEIRFHYNSDSVGTVYVSYSMEIIEISEDGIPVFRAVGW